ncbi:MAG TPA: dihydrodipicolinate synthase family protein [Candidatus Limnocylindria bacterium]|nr:dihydrodipicolinate synthase family protein [Candidatus Limnocylindria bacterium]
MPSLSWSFDRPPLIVAAVTPLADDGERVDEEAIWPLTAFFAEHGADGVFACGTTGEGILLSLDERRRVTVAFRAAVRGRLIVHAGAQSSRDTSALAAQAAEIGADGVAVIPPPYFALDDDALTAHFLAAAAACAPLPFFIYVFAARSGYPVPVPVVERVRESAANLAGLKVSESPLDRVLPYLELELPVLVGSEPLIPGAMARGAVGSVSGLATAFPDVVRGALDQPDDTAEQQLTALRALMERQPFIAAAKHILARRGVPVRPDMRRPMRPLTAEEAAALDAALATARAVVAG